MNYRVRTLLVCAALGVLPAALDAQRGGGRKNQVDPLQGRPMQNEQRLGQALKTQLNLTDAQTTRLQGVTSRFNQRRVGLNQEERQARMTIREALCGGDTTRSADVAKSLDQVIDVEKRRTQMLEEEQRELSGFLTPYQRARYMGMIEQVGAALGGGRGGRAGRAGPPPGGAPPDSAAGPPPQGRPGRAMQDMCANPAPPPNGGKRGRGGI